jgi:hypothetical protein
MQDRQPAVLAVTLVVFVLASIFVGLRIVSRIGIIHQVRLHDYFMILAWVRDEGFMGPFFLNYPPFPPSSSRQ